MRVFNLNEKTHWIILFTLTTIIYYPLSSFAPSSIIVSIFVGAFYARRIKELKIKKNVYALSQVVIGCFIGLSIKLNDIIMSSIPLYFLIIVSIVLIFLSLAIGLLATKSNFLPGTTGLWGMLPGAAPMMIILSERKNAVPGLVAFIQYTRVVLVSLLASIVMFSTNKIEFKNSLQQAHNNNTELFIFTTGIFILLSLFKKIMTTSNVFLLSIFYSITVCSIGFSIKIPNIILSFAFIILGWNIGFSFTNEIILAARKSFTRVFILIITLILLCYFLSFLLICFFNIDPLTAYLSTSPGGIDSIAIIASGTSANLAIVIRFQLVRFLILLLFGEKIVNFTHKIYLKLTTHKP